MTVFESLGQTAEDTTNSAKNYINATEGYFKLQIFKHLALLMTFVIKGVAIGGVLLLALTFFAVCGVLLLSEWLESLMLACLILGCLFLLFGALIYFNRSAINRRVISNLSKKF